MFIARGSPKKDGDSIIAEKKIGKEEFEKLLEIFPRMSSETHWKTKEILFLKLQSIQIPEQELILKYKNEGVIDLEFPNAFCDEFFIELNQICQLIGASLFDFDSNEIPKSKYEQFLNKEYSLIKREKYSEAIFGNQQNNEWIGIYGGSQEEIVDFFELIESDLFKWDKAVQVRGGGIEPSRIAMTPSLNGWTFLHVLDSLVIYFLDPITFKVKNFPESPYEQSSYEEERINFANKVSQRFLKVVYSQSSTKFGIESSFYSQNGSLIYGTFSDNNHRIDFGDKLFFSKVFKNNQFDFTRAGFAINPQDLLFSKEILKPIKIFEIPKDNE